MAVLDGVEAALRLVERQLDIVDLGLARRVGNLIDLAEEAGDG